MRAAVAEGPAPELSPISMAELYERTYEPPVAVVEIDPCLPDWHDESYGGLISYNSGTPVSVGEGEAKKWYIPVRAEYKNDEHYSVVLWRTWQPGAIPEFRDGRYVITLGVPESAELDGLSPRPGENEVWFPGQDPSVWRAKLPKQPGGEPEELLYESHTEVGEAWTEKGERGIKYWTVIRAGSDPANMETVFTSSAGNKDIFGVPLDDGSMVLITRPQTGDSEGSMPEAGPGKLAILHISSRDELSGLSYNPAKGPAEDPLKKATIVHGFGEHGISWVGAKQGRHIGGDLIEIDGAHMATWLDVPSDVEISKADGAKLDNIRLYCGARVILNYKTGEVMDQEITAVPWDIHQDIEPKRDELSLIAFSSGLVSDEARITPPEGVDDTGDLRQEIVSYGDSGLRLIIRHRRGFDSPEVRDAAKKATLRIQDPVAAAGDLSLRGRAYRLIRERFPAPSKDIPPGVALRVGDIVVR